MKCTSVSSHQRSLRRPYGQNKVITQQKKIVLSLLFILSSLLFVLIILNCTPPVSRDALTHHLAVPKLYLTNGGIFEIPNLSFSYYPMNLDLLYLIPLWFGYDTIPKFIHLLFGLATAWLVYQHLQKRLNSVWGLTGALFFLTTPVIVHLATSAYVDLGLTFFTTASVLLLLRWNQAQKLSPLILAGLCAGLAAGTKYNGLLVIFLLSCFIPFMKKDSDNHSTKQSSNVYAALLFCSVAILAVSPWLIRNYVWTGNPTYPLFQFLFSTEQAPLTQGMNPLLIRKIIYHESLLQTLLIPIRIFFEGQDNNPQFFDGVLNPFLLFFFLAALIPYRVEEALKREKKLFVWFIVLFLLFTFVQRVIRIRYIVPILPFITILGMYGLFNLQSFLWAKKYRHTAVLLPLVLLVTAFSLNGNYLLNHWQKIRPLEYISGKMDRTTFISRFWPEYPLVDYANKNLPRSANILAVFLGNRGYYFDRSVQFDLNEGKSLLHTLAKEHRTSNEIADSLNEMGISHLLIREDLFRQNNKRQLTAEEQQRLSLFLQKFTTTIATTNNHSLRTLLTKDNPLIKKMRLPPP